MIGRSHSTKLTKGFVVMEKVGEESREYQIRFSTLADKKGRKFQIDKNCLPIIFSPLIDTGKLTMVFSVKPPTSVMISKAKPDSLKHFLALLNEIKHGRNINLKNGVVIKKSDFKQTKIEINEKTEYEKQMRLISDKLETMIIQPIGLTSIDTRWRKCKSMSKLVVAGNPIGIGRASHKLMTINQLIGLRELDLGDCRLKEFDQKCLISTIKQLPKQLVSLSLAANRLRYFPPIFGLEELVELNLSRNRICYVPARIIGMKKLRTLDLTDNDLGFLPDLRKKTERLTLLKLDGNFDLLHPRNINGKRFIKPLPKRSGGMYTHPGGVDTLVTISATAVNKNEALKKIASEILPLTLKFEATDYDDLESLFTPMEMCMKCKNVKFIRNCIGDVSLAQNMAESTDVYGFAAWNVQTLCIDCFRRPPQKASENEIKTFFEGKL